MRRIDVAGTGFTVLDRLYPDDAKAATSEALGGSCGNVLLSLAMLRRHVAPVLVLGLDALGSRMVDAFKDAGAETRFISRRPGVRSPVLVQRLDTQAGHHSFAFTCPETDVAFPRYTPIEPHDVEAALPVLTGCAVFYADRMSETILAAMEAAGRAGAIVYFEPSDIDQPELFERAVKSAMVLKFSVERLGELADHVALAPHAVAIVTYGDAGLEIRQGRERRWCRAHRASNVRDTCGSGDMVSIGVIDWMLKMRMSASAGLDLADLVPGVVAGQRLAAENCAYEGARGLFTRRGAQYARAVLDGSTVS